MFAGQDISETGNGELLWYFSALAEKDIGCADGNKIINCLNGGGFGFLVYELQSRLRSILDGIARLKNQPVIILHVGIAEGLLVSLQTLPAPWHDLGAAEERNLAMAQLQ